MTTQEDLTAAQATAQQLGVDQPTSEAAQPTTQPIDYLALYQAEKQKNEDLQAVITAGKYQPTPPPPGSDVKPKTYEQARAQVGQTRWCRMSNAEKLVTLGQDPNQDLEFVRKNWGKGADPQLSGDLYKTNPKLYRQTKEAALALGIWRN
jgi:hypothetical protein